jgi:hypothetical protein
MTLSGIAVRVLPADSKQIKVEFPVWVNCGPFNLVANESVDPPRTDKSLDKTDIGAQISAICRITNLAVEYNS